MSCSANPRGGVARHVAWCCLPQVLFLLLAVGLLQGGGMWWLLPLGVLLVVVPALDWLTGWQDDATYGREAFTAGHRFILAWNTRLYALLYMGSVSGLAAGMAGRKGWELGLLVGLASFLGGIGFAAAHELLHGKSWVDQALQRVLTSFLFYPHYKLIHIRSHHVHAGTDHDENTAWLDETVYAYLWRTIPGSMVRCWQMEVRRCAGARAWPLALARNRMVHYALGQIAILAGFQSLTGGWGLVFYLAHLAGAHVVLESVNYIQHYGLLRRRNPAAADGDGEGEYEKTGAEHSWDTYHFFSSYMTFRVGHHSHHHLAVQPYYLLQPEPEAPKLPVGYFWAIAVVLLPPWWKRVIHPRFLPRPLPST